MALCRLQLLIKVKPWAKPVLVLVYLFGRFMPQQVKSWAFSRCYSIDLVSIPVEA